MPKARNTGFAQGRIFPEPKHAHFKHSFLVAHGFRYEFKGLSAKSTEKVAFLLERLFPTSCSVDTPVTIAQTTAEKHYYLTISAETGIELHAPVILIPAALQTLRQIADRSSDGVWRIPEGEVVDSPDYDVRGLYIESYFGSDRMALEDWFELVEVASSLKLNTLTISIYGCWTRRWLASPEEFFFFKSSSYPVLQSKQAISYYSARSKRAHHISYQPVIAEKHLFPEIVAFADKFGITVTPHFNTLGHNTLIPRLFPELSAKNRDGSPRNLSFCLSNPAVLAFLKNLFAEIIAESRVDSFHIGFDEVYRMSGVDLVYPNRKTSPWCACPSCRSSSCEELVLNYALDLISFLKTQGIKRVSLWHDQLTRMNLVKRFEDKLRENRLEHLVVLECWHYHDLQKRSFISPSTKAVANFCVPMAGFQFWGHYPDHTGNITSLLEQERHDACGTEAYALYSPSFHYNFSCLANYAWNASAKTAGFLNLYVNSFFPADKFPGFTEQLQKLLDAESFGLGYFLFNDAAGEDYPADRVCDLILNHSKIVSNLPTLTSLYHDSESYFKSWADSDLHDIQCSIMRHLYFEAARCTFLCETFGYFCTNLKITALGLQAREIFDTEQILTRIDEIIEIVENYSAYYLQPHTLRFITMIREFVTDGILPLPEQNC